MKSKILVLCFFLVSIGGDTAQVLKHLATARNKTVEENFANKIKIRSKIKSTKISDNILVTKSVRKKGKRKFTSSRKENVYESLQNLVGMLFMNEFPAQ